MSEIFIYNLDTYAEIIEFDADTKESRQSTAKVTDKPVEDGANLSDMINSDPDKFRLEGQITAWPFDQAADPSRVKKAEQSLRSAMANEQPVGLMTHWWSEQVLLTSVDIGQSAGDGEKVTISIECQTFRLVSPEYTKIPPAKLKPAVRKRATAAPPKGGAAAGKKVQPKTTLNKLATGLGINL